MIKKFISTFIICAVIYGAATAMIQADLESRGSSGNFDRSLISYEEKTVSEGRLQLFGQVYTIDLDMVRGITDKVADTLANNAQYIPDFLINTCVYIGNSVKSLCQALAK